MLLQKTYHLDHISKKRMVNCGEFAQYYVENSHEPIIDKDTFNRVQREIDRRAEKSGLLHKQPTVFPFTGILRCGICGKFYRRRITHAGSKYTKAAWICPTFVNRGKSTCPSRQIPEDILVRKTGEVLHTDEFDRNMLLTHLTELIVSAPDQLTYVFRDGRTEVVAWQNHSRRDSWTEEMKLAARERAAENAKRRRKNGKA